MADTLERLKSIFQEVFEDDALVVARATAPQDIERWDSLMHVSLVVAVENAFDIQFTTSEVTELKSVGDFVERIERRLGAETCRSA